MYVAITRARKRLYLSFSQTRMLHGQTRYNVKSRFLDELPESGAALDHAAQPGLRLGLCARVQRGLGARLGAALDRRRRSRRAACGERAGVAHAAPTHGLRPGQGVFHTKFGEGVVVTLEGSGDDARAQVNFGRHGMKWLALCIAKLTPVD